MDDRPYFNRPELAQRMAAQILSTAIGSAATSGLFLAAPRRTGKSTFLREDLRPALIAAGALVVYVDLWEDKTTDPGKRIVGAIRAELLSQEGALRQLARWVGLEKLSVGGATFAVDHIGLDADVSLSRALAALSDDIRRPIVLIIDEAQHAITTEAGAAALFALKAARDELNSTQHFGLRIVATGSNRDKLTMLRNGKDQAFYGAAVAGFPSLGREFVDWFCARVALFEPLDPQVAMQCFEQASYRPEVMAAAANSVRFDFDESTLSVTKRFEAAVAQELAVADEHALRVLHALTPLQSAVLRVLAVKGRDYAPFESETLAIYASFLSKIAPRSEIKPDLSNVQAALQALQDKGLVWREARGVYALEDAATADLMQRYGLLDLPSTV